MLKNIYAIGGGILRNTQAAVSVHGQNIANASTPGYRRRTVDFKTSPYISFGGHDFGTGSELQRLRRHFDTYLAAQQHEKNGDFTKWSALRGNLGAMDALFKDSAEKGLTKSMTEFWNQWRSLSENPGQNSSRTALVGKAESLAALLRTKRQDMQSQLALLDKAIAQDTSKANKIMGQLAEINRQIVQEEEPGQLADVRDRLLEDLSRIVPVKTIRRDDGQVIVSLRSGQPLVDGTSAFELKYENPKVIRELTDTSTFDGTVGYFGKSNKSYTIECISGGPTDGSAGAAKFRASTDGGKTWLTNPDGTVKEFTASPESGKIKIGDISVWFGKQSDISQAATTPMAVGDTFQVKPKSNLYWYQNSSTFEDITPQNGNEKQITGGSLAGLLQARDAHISEYAKKLDALAKSMIWEVNFAHSQGAGSKHLNSALGSYKVDKANQALGSSSLPFAEKLKKGNFSIAVFGANGNNEVVKPVNFSSINPPGVADFDPAVHTLENVKDAINASFPGQTTASIENGRLRISAASGKKISFAGDSSGLLAGLGINTFFKGKNASDIALDSVVKADVTRICAGHVNGAGEVNSGDNTVARKLADMSTKIIDFDTDPKTSNTFQGFLSNLIAQVGSDTAQAESAKDVSLAQVKFLNNQQESVSGVNMKEEMIKIKQYQQSYQSAAQLIKIANEMYQTILTLK